MFRPTRLAIALIGLGVVAALLPALISPALWVLWLVFDSILLLAFLFDVLAAPNGHGAKAVLKGPDILYLANPSECSVQLRLPRNRSTLPLTVRLQYEADFEIATPNQMQIKSGRGQFSFSLCPQRRGLIQFVALWYRLPGPLRLTERFRHVELNRDIAVVPNINIIKKAALRMASSKMLMAGLKRQRFVGDGSEFESLREYQPGYDHRAIDWKVSARQRKLLVREFEAERNMRIVLAFDTGRLMSQPIGELPKLDHAISAGLMLALLSLKQGDRVGMMGFDEEVGLYLSPQGGLRTLEQLLTHSGKLRYSQTDTNFTKGLAELNAKMRRRAIIVVLTDFHDTITAEQMVGNLGQLAKRHLVIFVSLRDPELLRLAACTPASPIELNRAVVATDLVRDRDIVLQRLRRLGIFCIDAKPEEISVQLLNRYLDVKRRGLA